MEAERDAEEDAAPQETLQQQPQMQEGLALEHEVSPAELMKWGEMVRVGVGAYMRQHPDRFHRRVRRGIPPRYRWRVWKAAVSLHERPLLVDYQALSARENQWTDAIEIDLRRTFPDVRSFDNVQQQRLFRVLNAYASYNPNVGYCQGMNFVAGLLLLVSGDEFHAEEESFGMLVSLMDHVGLAGFYTGKLPLLRRYLRACDQLVAEMVPDLRDHFIKENVQPAVYMHQWFLTLFINCFPLSMVSIIWDVIICEGLPVIIRIAVSILQVLKDSLLSMHFEEIVKFFKMMRTYEDEEGELNAFRIGQLLMKHTEQVVIPERVLEYLTRDPLHEDEANLDSDESWEADLTSNSWLQSFSRMFSFSSTRRRAATIPSTSVAPPMHADLGAGQAPATIDTGPWRGPAVAVQASTQASPAAPAPAQATSQGAPQATSAQSAGY